jgi:hypothetical protein
MANITQSNNTFVGNSATGFISGALLQGKTLANNWIKIRPNVRYKQVLQKFDYPDAIQTYSANFSHSGTPTKNEVVLTITDLMTNVEYPKKQLENDWQSELMTGDATHTSPSKDFINYAIDQLSKTVGQQIELNLWRGNNTGNTTAISGYTKFTGLYRSIDTASGVNRVTATAITKSNVISMLDAVYAKGLVSAPAIMADVTQLAFYVSPATGGYFQQAQTLTATDKSVVGARPMDYLGIEVRVCPGCNDDRIVLCNPDRLNFGTLLVDDTNSVSVLDMTEQTLDLNIRMRMDYKCGTAVDYGAEVIYFA